MKNIITKSIKASVGCCIAIAIALVLNLSYATSAGVITLLSLQNNKKETIVTAFKRAVAFTVGVLISYLCFHLIGYNVAAIGVYLIFFVAFCYAIDAQNAVAMCTVLITHFWIEKSMSIDWIYNESMLLIIGAGVGILLNMFMTSQIKTIRKDQSKIDNHIKRILYNLAGAIKGENEVDSEEVDALKTDINTIKNKTTNSINNALTVNYSYFVEYIDLRKNQHTILARIKNDIINLETKPIQSYTVSEFLEKIADSFNECNNAEGLLDLANEIREQFKKEALPKTREEFEARAILFHIIGELEHFLLLKSTFVQSLTQKEKELFWDNSCAIN